MKKKATFLYFLTQKNMQRYYHCRWSTYFSYKFIVFVSVVSLTVKSSLTTALSSSNTGTTTMSTPFDTSSSKTTTKNILYDIPVSNNGGRCRIILYKKGMSESEISIMSPIDIGGFKSQEFLAISPQGKVPAFQRRKDDDDTTLCIAESDTICRFLLTEYAHLGPSFLPNHPISNEIARMHDMYLTTIQSCLYRASPPFGQYNCRKDAIHEYSKQLYVISNLINNGNNGGPYFCGDQVSLADATLFPSIVFASYMFPKFDHGIQDRSPIPQSIQNWYQRMIDTDPAFRKVYEEIHCALVKWDEKRRWDTIWLAGVRDTEPGTIFDKIISKEIPATIVKEDDKILAFRDINPAAPQHVLVIPKDREGLTRLSKATPEHYEILGRLMVAAGEIAKDESLGFGDGARIVINDGRSAGQEVFHLHVHVMGGREFSWPPG